MSQMFSSKYWTRTTLTTSFALKYPESEKMERIGITKFLEKREKFSKGVFLILQNFFIEKYFTIPYLILKNNDYSSSLL